MKKFKTILAALLCVVLSMGAVTALTGCSAKENELIVYTMFGGDDPLKEYFQVGVNSFKKDNPDVAIEDQSIQAVGEGFDSVMTAKFVGSEKYHPDILYVFSPGRNKAIQSKLATVDDIRAKFPDYGKGFPSVVGDPTALAFLGNTFGMFYEKDVFTPATDFASFTALRNKLKTLETSKIVDATGEMNTWFNYIGLQKMGKKWADVLVPDAAWFTANKAELVGVLNEMLAYCKTDLGMGVSSTTDYGAQKADMWNGNKSFDVNGNWNAGGWYAPNSEANKGGNYAVENFVVDDNPATTDIDESKYVMAGFFHGWMISKKCFNDEKKLALAVDFINRQCANAGLYGGLTANGAVSATDNALVKQSKELLKKEGAIMCSPMDDKFMNATAKKTLYDGFKSLMTGAITATDLIESTIASFAE